MKIALCTSDEELEGALPVRTSITSRHCSILSDCCAWSALLLVPPCLHLSPFHPTMCVHTEQAGQDAMSQTLCTYLSTYPPHRPFACVCHASPPQGKLGKLPKNQRLKDAMAQHQNAKPKPKGWLMSAVDQIYKDGGSWYGIFWRTRRVGGGFKELAGTRLVTHLCADPLSDSSPRTGSRPLWTKSYTYKDGGCHV